MTLIDCQLTLLLYRLPCVCVLIPAVPDAAEQKRERDSIDRGVRMGQERLKKAKADPLAAFDEAMQEAASNGFESKLAAMTREQRYQIFFENLQQAEKRSKKAGPDEVYTVDFFSVFTQEELRSFRGLPSPPEAIGGGRRLLYNNPSEPMPCACGGPSERPFQYGAVDVTNIPAVTWRAYTTPIRNQQSSSACGMFAVTAVIEAGFYMKWYTRGWNTSNIDLSEQDLVSSLASRACSTALKHSMLHVHGHAWPHLCQQLPRAVSAVAAAHYGPRYACTGPGESLSFAQFMLLCC